MTEFFNVLTPGDALAALLNHIPPRFTPESLAVPLALDRVTASPLLAPFALPSFPRSVMDGYAVRAKDAFGASASLPAFLSVVGEAPMGRAPEVRVGPGEAAMIHTGGMLPEGADAVVRVENTQVSRESGSYL